MGFLDHPGQLMCMLGQEVSVTRFKSQEDAILQARAFLDRSDDPAVPPFLRISFLSRDTCVDTPSWAAKKIASFWWERREAFAPAAIGGPLADMGVSAPFSYFCRQDGILTYFTQRMTALRTLDPHGFSAREGARKRFSAFCGTLVLQVERESQIEHFPAYAPPAPLLPPKQQRQIPARFEWSEPLSLISRMPVARHVA
jgi:hypothetical protein